VEAWGGEALASRGRKKATKGGPIPASGKIAVLILMKTKTVVRAQKKVKEVISYGSANFNGAFRTG